MRSKNLQYSFVTNLLFLITINLIIKPIWVFVIDRNAQLHLGFDQYGVYYALLNITYLFGVVLDLGLTNFHQREVSQNNNAFTRLFGNIFSVKWLLSVVYILVCIFFAWLWKYDVQKISWLLWLVGSQILVSFILFFRSTLSAMQYYFLDSFLSVCDKGLMIVIIGYFLFFNTSQFTIQTFIIGQFAAYFITFILSFFLVIKFRRPVEKPAINELKIIIKNARPFTMLLLWMTIYFRLDSVLVERLSIHQAQEESGIYAAAYRLLDMINMFAFLFSMLLYPMFSKLIAEKKSLNNLIQLSSPILLSTAWIVCCSIFFGKVEWLKLLYHRNDLYAANVMVLVIASFFGVALQYIYSTAVTASGNLKLQNKAAATAVIFNAISNIIFIPQYGAMAAAINAFITLTGMGIANYFFARKIFKLNFDFKKLLLWLPWAMAVIFLARYSCLISSSFLLNQLTLMMLCLTIGWLIKVLPIKHFISILKDNKY